MVKNLGMVICEIISYHKNDAHHSKFIVNGARQSI